MLIENELMQSQSEGSIVLKGFDYIELYMGNAHHAAHFYRTAFGFTPIGYAGLETGEREHASFILEQGEIRLILTSAILPESPVADHVRLHGDSVKDIAFTVDDAERAFELAVRRGSKPVMEPTTFEDERGMLTKATISAFGDTVHSFIAREGDSSSDRFFPKFQELPRGPRTPNSDLLSIDHVAISLEPEGLDKQIDFYKEVLGFHQSHQEDITTNYSAMNSRVVQDSTGLIKFPMMEPAPGRRKSQIEEYLYFNRGPGVQHLALLSDNIVRTVRNLRASSIDFLRTPQTYYNMLEDRVGKIDEDLEALRDESILVDRDDWGYLLQIFTRPLQSRPTLFFEVIQRIGARGFGGGNIRALFEAIEREQAMRGNL